MEVMKQVGLTQEIFAGINQNLQDGWTEWADNFLWTLMSSLEVTKARLKNSIF